MASNGFSLDRDRIADFCRRRRVREFSIFGSALREDFRPDSDVDVMVSFAPEADWSLLDIVEMIEELKGIFGRDVDLVEKEAMRNPYRRRAIMSNREVVYAA